MIQFSVKYSTILLERVAIIACILKSLKDFKRIHIVSL